MPAPPRATYRLQLRGGLGFAEAAALVPYLARLQVSHLYLSPPFAAVAGSTHGYDVVDPNRLDPTLGGEPGFMALSETLKRHGLGLLLDIVPNHMGIGRDNAWWWDVLEHGRASPYAGYFDIDFDADPDGKLVLPVLGGLLDAAIECGELRVVRDEPGDRPFLGLGEGRFPLNGDPQAPLRDILAGQPYRLIPWQEGAQRRNYRRFFNIDQLAGLRVELPEVFETSHRLIFELVEHGLVQGLRIDHIDGLTDPKAYLDRLQGRLAELRPEARPFYLVVEKILIGDEQLPPDWPVAGTTGYEFMNETLGLLVDRPGLWRLDELATAITGEELPFKDVAQEAKALVLERLFAGELETLSRRAAELCGLELETARAALQLLLPALPVYRTYGGAGWRPEDVGVLEQAFATAQRDAPPELVEALRRIEHALAQPQGEDGQAFVQALQQLSGPLMAKSVEDTAFYRHGRLLALNEVGGEPDAQGLEPASFHRLAARRLEQWPDTLLATATHDTKRGEDGRARLAILSELADEWSATVTAWRGLNAALPPIHPSDEYMLYQSLVGAWPVELDPGDAAGLEGLGGRLEGWLLKSLREGKERSDWNEPDAPYERRAVGFLRSALAGGGDFAQAACRFVRRIAPAGLANSLAQLLLKLTVPGVPDIYQGTELGDFSLVDPDNRRPVDFALRTRLLAEGGWDAHGPKLYLLARGLALRAGRPELFARGRYHPLAVDGPRAINVLAFGRVLDEQVVIAVISRRLGRELAAVGAPVLGQDAWQDTTVTLPHSWWTLSFRNQLRQGQAEIDGGRLALAPLLGRLPVALLATG